MNGNFSTEHWKNEAETMSQEINNEITNVPGAIKILGISRASLVRWEQEELIKSFKSSYNGRMRKCFYVSELKKLAGQGDPISS